MNPRRALLPWTEMAIFRTVKLRPLFQAVTLALPEAQSVQIWYKMKDIDIIFVLIPFGLVWSLHAFKVKKFCETFTQKQACFWSAKNWSIFLKMLLFQDQIRF